MIRYLKLGATMCALLGVTSALGASLANTNNSVSIAVALGSALALVLLNLRSK